ncbi:Y-family DNA polymerase [Thermithiobacillus plumbiphilus]|uniref:Y-family DNA polymerase n=1 Tax=Thermithiobacillus plumbiphilus TaxID=1729899 RepID=A0ABU9D5E1_9PROT
MTRAASLALVDCNNFYASCERLFRPDLLHRAIVVLSNNDGCVVARSAEAKMLGIPMGVPLHQVQHLIRQHGVVLFSSNYALYGDISRRVMTVLSTLAPDLEVYSIDEAFLDLSGIRDIEPHAHMIRATVRQWTGIPVSIGIAPTKTLSKVANRLAKKDPALKGVMDLRDSRLQEQLLRDFPVGDVWGIGRRLAEKLDVLGIGTALQLRDADTSLLRARFGVVMERLVRELRGEKCLDLESQPAPKQQIIASRSFGQPVTGLHEVQEAVSHHVARAAARLRSQYSIAQTLQIQLYPLPFGALARQASIQLSQATADTSEMIRVARQVVAGLYQPGQRYRKAGVMLLDLAPPGVRQASLFSAPEDPKRQQLMHTLDGINAQFGRAMLRFAAEGIEQPWAMRAGKRSPRYTTCWGELARVR